MLTPLSYTQMSVSSPHFQKLSPYVIPLMKAIKFHTRTKCIKYYNSGSFGVYISVTLGGFFSNPHSHYFFIYIKKLISESQYYSLLN